MLTVTKISDVRLNIDLEGGIDSNIMAAGLDDLFAKSDDMTNGIILYTITDLQMPTLGAIGIELERIPKLFGLLGKFKKCAVLCDFGWIRATAEIEGALIPGLDIKSFELHERDAAEAWLETA